MSRLPVFFRIARNQLRSGGQRVVVALLCIAFGVMSLVSMMVLSGALERMLIEEPHDIIGADISMGRATEDFILPEHVAGLEKLQAEGVLETYTLVAHTSSLTFRRPDSGELHFAAEGIGIEPAAYPPIGELTVENSTDGLADLLEAPGDVLVSRDLALEYGLSAGDRLVLSDLSTGAPVEATVRGIIADTPNHKGSKFYYSLETAERLAASGRALNTVLATTAQPDTARTRLGALGWDIYLAETLAAREESVQELLAGFLNGAGVLGLLVGGVGIATTMQVLMRRRQREIAVWKTLGYRSGDLLLLFSLEAGLLGLGGSLLGAVLGLAVSAGLVDLFSRTSTMLIRWVVSPEAVLLAVLVGTATTLVFALWAIVANSRVWPVALLRGEAVSAAQMPWLQAAGLLIVLAVPLVSIISLIMGTVNKALIVLAAALFGLAGLGGGLWVVLWLLSRLLPRRAIPLLNLTRSNLQRRGFAPAFALIALFVGVVALAFSGVVTQNASRVLAEASADIQGDNLTVLAPAAQADSIAAALSEQPVERWSLGYRTRVHSIHLSGDPEETFAPLLIARQEPTGYTLSGVPWGSRPDGVYVSLFAQLKPGSELEVTLWDGTVRTLPVVGSYQEDAGQLFGRQFGVLLPVSLSESLAPPDQVQAFVRVPANRLGTVARALGEALPDATVINMVAYHARFTRTYRNFFLFAVSMASLALLAGVLLMANSVTLSVLDQRYEIGVLKAVGYTHRQLVTALMVEYALIALVAIGSGLVLVQGFLWLMGMQNPLAKSLMVLTLPTAGFVALFTVGLTVLTVLATGWKSTRVSPMILLNDRI